MNTFIQKMQTVDNSDCVSVLEMSEPSCPGSPSGSSVRSDFDNPISRQSPSLCHEPSPSMVNFLFQKPESSGLLPDSESSSRSSLDSHMPTKEQPGSITSFRESRSRDRANSSESSSSDESVLSKATSFDGEEMLNVRKTSRSLDPPSAALLKSTDAPRGRLANIRRESSSSVDSEMAHERLVKASQRVSTAWEDLSLGDRVEGTPEMEDEKKLKSETPKGANCVTEPISILTNAFFPQSCSPSPTRFDTAKQCYSPSTQQIVRANIPYSPSPSPTRSPTSRKLIRLRSQSPSPIVSAMRPSLKRRMNDCGQDETKRFCQSGIRNTSSPLVQDRSFPFQFPTAIDFTQPFSQSRPFTPPKQIRRLSADGLGDVKTTIDPEASGSEDGNSSFVSSQADSISDSLGPSNDLINSPIHLPDIVACEHLVQEPATSAQTEEIDNLGLMDNPSHTPEVVYDEVMEEEAPKSVDPFDGYH